MAIEFNRRTFVQHAVAATAGIWHLARPNTARAQDAAAAVPPANQTSSSDASHDSATGGAGDRSVPVSVGMMGLSRGMALAELFAPLPGVTVKYVCDVDSQRAASAAQRLAERFPTAPAPRVVSDFRRILDDAQIDALVCAAPNHWHGPATLLAAAAGKHTYVEKPCCHNPREGEWMVDAAKRHGTLIQTGTQRRSSPGTIEAMRRLHAGDIGRVYLARSWYSNRRPSIGRGQVTPVPPQLNFDLWQGPAPHGDYVDNLVHYNWHWRWHWGNGELGNNGIHALDLCRWGLQVDFPTAVVSSGGRYAFQDDQETPDTHTVALEFADRKAITWHGLSCNSFDQDWITFYGDQGTLDLQVDGAFTIYDAQRQPVMEHRVSDSGERQHVANFVAAIRSRDAKMLNCPIHEAHRSALLCHLGNIAQRVGQRLECDPANGRVLNQPAAMALWQREYDPRWPIGPA